MFFQITLQTKRCPSKRPDDTLPTALPERVWRDEEWLAVESEADKEQRVWLKEMEAKNAARGDLPAWAGEGGNNL